MRWFLRGSNLLMSLKSSEQKQNIKSVASFCRKFLQKYSTTQNRLFRLVSHKPPNMHNAYSKEYKNQMFIKVRDELMDVFVHYINLIKNVCC